MQYNLSQSFITSHIHTWALFLLWLHLFILSGVISLFFPSTGHLPTWGVHCLVSSLFAFSYCSWGSQARIGLPFPSPVHHIFLELSTMTCCLGLPYMAGLIVSLSQTRLFSVWSVWLIFCDCGFHFVCPLRDKDKRLMEASWWETLTVGETGSCSDGRGLVNLESNLLLMVWIVIPPCFLTWDQTMVEVMKIMVTSFKRSSACTATLRAPDPAAGHHGSMSPLETPVHSWASVGQSLERSLLLFPGPWCAQPCFCPPV